MEELRISYDGTAVVWEREYDEKVLRLSYRGMRQALPDGASPLAAFGGHIICGQHFTVDEVRDFIKHHLNGDYSDIVIFETGEWA